MELVYLFVGLVIGALLAWLVLRLTMMRRLGNTGESAQLRSLQIDLSVKDERQRQLEKQIEQLQVVDNQNTSEREGLIAQLAAANEQVKLAQELTGEMQKLRDDFNLLQQKAVGLDKENVYLKQALASQKKDVEEIGLKFTNEFKLLADQILEDKSKRFTLVNQENITQLLKPLGESIVAFQKQVQETYEKESRERFSLAAKVKELADLNQVISQEAKNLTNALKGQVKKQGDWGEMILESILENSGLRKDLHYFTQKSVREDETGRTLRPDVVVSYPDGRKLVIDSKVSLVAYDRYCSATDVDAQKAALHDLLASMRTHVDELAVKKYSDLVEGALDAVMMFVPVEPAFLVAIDSDRELWNYAYQKRVLLMSPTNLIPALRLVYDLWQHEMRNRNVEEIAKRGGQLHDKIVGFLESFSQLGDKLTGAKDAYDKALGQLSQGAGNLIRQAQELEKLGAKVRKTIPDKFSQMDVLDSETV